MSSVRVVVGVCGGIASYKSATLVSRLAQRGFDVSVVLTRNALEFVGEATFSALCNRAPVVDGFDKRFPLGPHIELAEDLQLLIIAPATARMIGSCAQGLADDVLATLYLQATCPVLMAPAMSTAMWEKPAVQRNVDQLKRDGVHFVGPESGWLSCRKIGAGRMSEPDSILEASLDLLGHRS